jgi:TPR repeat protein
MKTIMKTLLLLIALSAVPVFAQSDFEATKARAEAGDAEAQYSLGVMYASGEVVAQDYQEAVKWYRLAAEQGNASAQYSLGFMYEEGRGVAQSDQEVVKWYTLAAELGNLDAQFALGLMYGNGSGVEKDSEEAFKWIRLASAQTRMAQMLLCIFYRDGVGTAQNYSRAYVWCSVAAAQSDYDGAVAERDRIRNLLTPQSLEQAQAQATRCFESNFKDCD